MNFSLILACIATNPGGTTVLHEFRYMGDPSLKTVSLAGTFNGWNKDANPMQKQADGRTWTVRMQIPVGRHQYKFVLNGENWVTDPKAAKNEDDGNGNINSVLVIVPADFTKPASPSDGELAGSVLGHHLRVPMLNYDRGRLTLSMTIRPNDAKSVSLAVKNGTITPTRVITQNEITETRSVTLPWDRRAPLRYAFRIEDGAKSFLLGPKGLTPANSDNFFELNAKNYQPFTVPKWVQGTVFYQIFPDRFANAKSDNDPKDVQKWTDEPTWFNRFGGDAEGVRRGIPYLKELGVNGIYINPIMAAPSNHRYDPVDFFRVDKEFGTNAEFIRLTEEMDRAGIKVVLDQIFDHVGVTFAPFADVLRWQEKSRYKDWFNIKSYPVEVRNNPPYEAWWGFESMPKIRVQNPEVKAYLFESVDYWMKSAKLAGWRLDVANEVPFDFWRDFRVRVKGNDPEAWIVGEVWSDASAWLEGDQWDASMNYPFRGVVIGFVAQGKSKPSEFVRGLQNVYGLYAPQVSRNQLNLLSSHDVPRFITEAGGNRKLAAMGAVVQFTWPGAPSVYYGEELGMLGGADPLNRRSMRWDMVNGQNELLRLYQKLTYARVKSELLAEGDPVILEQRDADNVAAFGREWQGDFAAVVLNRSEKVFGGTIQLPKAQANTEFVDLLTGKTMMCDASGRLRVDLAPLSSSVALKATPKNKQLVRGALAAATSSLQEKPK